MFGCCPKYFSERLKLERVYKYALQEANKLHKSNTKCSKQLIILGKYFSYRNNSTLQVNVNKGKYI